jgi:hypothetical protein
MAAVEADHRGVEKAVLDDVGGELGTPLSPAEFVGTGCDKITSEISRSALAWYSS